MTTDPPSDHLVLVIDDDPEAVALAERILISAGYRVATASSGEEGLAVLGSVEPTLVLLDVEMPGMNGYAVAEQIRSSARPIPVVFVTAHGEDESRAQAFSIGAVGYLVKPYKKDDLLAVIEMHARDLDRWQRLSGGAVRLPEAVLPEDFERFKSLLRHRAGDDQEGGSPLASAKPSSLYEAAQHSGIAPIDVAELLADFLNLDVVSALDPASVDLDDIPKAFGEKNHVVRLVTEDGSKAFALSNPFEWELLDVLEARRDPGEVLRLVIAEPEAVHALFRFHEERTKGGSGYEAGTITLPEGRVTLHERTGRGAQQIAASLRGVERKPVVLIANSLILEVIREGASDIHIEPQEDSMRVSFRIDGDLFDVLKLDADTGSKLVSRLKALAGLDISERRRPQSGSLDVNAGKARLKLRLATALGPHGESLVIRVLGGSEMGPELRDLGMSEEQASTLRAHVERTQGTILLVGPSSSGKTTTASRVLLSVDIARRSMVTVEDPVEYVIPRAHQQQVNDKAGLTFDSLLQSSVRQDPDVLFAGEVRDAFSAKTVVEFASAGHLTVSTLRAPDATSALSRLELFEVSRAHVADDLLCIVGQRLVKLVCPKCREISPVTDEERRILEPFTDDIPATTAKAKGCPACRGGHLGRRGIFEVIDVDERLSDWLRSDLSPKEIRARLWAEGAHLLHTSAMDGIREHAFSVAEAYAAVLVDEEGLAREVRSAMREETIGTREVERSDGGEAVVDVVSGPARILIAEDDESTLALLERVLADAGYDVSTAGDGREALQLATSAEFDLVLSDLRMPGLDGLELLEELKLGGVPTPVLLLTGSTEGGDEAAALEMGAADFVHKPIRRDVLLLRVARALGR